MDDKETLKQKILQISKKFFAEHLAINPGSIEIDIHSDCLVLTLQDAFSKAEKECVLDLSYRTRLEQFYKCTYDASKLIFESALDAVLPNRVTDSFISLHPESGKCIIVISIEEF